MKDKKYVNIFQKQDKILKYSKVRNGMTKKDDKQYLKSDNTLILDKKDYCIFIDDINYTNLKTLIIDERLAKDSVINIRHCTASNIYINNYKNLGGITIPYNFFIKNKSTIKLEWDKKYPSNINKINIVINDSIIPIDTKLIENITISVDKEILLIKVENYNSIIMYKINSLGDLEKEYMARQIKKDDIENNILDLRKYSNFKTICFFDRLELDKLILNKEILKNIFKYSYIFDRLKFNKLEIIDENEMKLFPTSIIVNIDDKDEILKGENDFYNNIICIKNKDNPKVIYLDKLDNIKVIDKNNILKDPNIEDAKISIKDSALCFTTNFLILIKYKNGKYKVILNEKEYSLTETFKNFLLLNKDIYVSDKILEDLKNSNWFNIIGKYNFSYSGFLEKYNDYLKYKNRITELKKLGFSYNALKYLYDRKINSIINTETEEGLINLTDIKEYEINAFNQMGEEYIKIKRLKK